MKKQLLSAIAVIALFLVIAAIAGCAVSESPPESELADNRVMLSGGFYVADTGTDDSPQ
jgi:hypothetical protein